MGQHWANAVITGGGGCNCCGGGCTPYGNYLMLPPLTEDTGTWYADCAEAEADVAANSSDCIAYIEPVSSGTQTISATDSPLTIAGSTTRYGTGSCPAIPTLSLFASVNLVNSDTLNVAWDYSAYISVDPFWDVTVLLYDNTATLVTSQTNSAAQSGSFNFTVPHTGRFIINYQCVGECYGPHHGSNYDAYSFCDYVTTSSGNISTNPIQATYDDGDSCPGLLDCGDACP